MAETKLGRRLRLGMVGGGPGAFIGAVHRIASRLDDRYELVAASLSSNPEKAAEMAKELFVARSYATFGEMAKAEGEREDGIDVVAIVTPNHLHFPIAKAFLEAGIHVICDKPMTINVAEAEELAALVKKTGLIFGLTHTYTGYPMIRQIRQMVLAGELGPIRMVQSEYTQDWLATPLEQTGAKQADWRTDPARSGPGGCLGDIGTHAFQLACWTTGLSCEQLAAEVTTFVPGRRVDDNVQVMLRMSNGAKAGLWASQVAVGDVNRLSLRIYGEKGGLAWEQENPNYVTFTPIGEQPRLLTRGGPGLSAAAAHASRVPAGHPEGYLEAFTQLYTDIADQIVARLLDRSAPEASLLVPGVEDGLTGMRFVDAVLRSAKNDSAWTTL